MTRPAPLWRRSSGRHLGATLMLELSAAERAYQLLKRDILGGAFPKGCLDIRRLGDRFRMSVTPVREALARLSAERLVRFAPHHGYAIASLSARRLAHLYDLTSLLVDLSLDRVILRGHAIRPAMIGSGGGGDYAETVAELLRDIAILQPNLELVEQIAALNDRLCLARRREPLVFASAEKDLRALSHFWVIRDLSSLKAGLLAYHTERIERADALARLLVEKEDGA